MRNHWTMEEQAPSHEGEGQFGSENVVNFEKVSHILELRNNCATSQLRLQMELNLEAWEKCWCQTTEVMKFQN